MAGIDSIIDRILKDARESADARVARAEQDAEKLIAKKKDQAKEEEGKMLADAQSYMTAAPWLIIFPTLMLVFYILGLYFISEWIRTSVKGGSL